MAGRLIFQTKWYTHEQMRRIRAQFQNSQDVMENAPIMLFGDNNIDVNRDYNTPRTFQYGQARVMGKYDKSIAYGITTYFHPNFNLITIWTALSSIWTGESVCKTSIDSQFALLQKYLVAGFDIVVPSPSTQEVRQNRYTYCNKDGQQVIFHNLGTGGARLSFTSLEYIQKKN